MIIRKRDKIAVLGLGMEGKDIANYLVSSGFKDITLFDKKEKSQLDLSGITCSKIKYITGEDYLSGGLTSYNTIFRSPGVYRFLPEIVEAEKSGSIITSGIDLFLNEFKGKTIGVTGTKGKGTTSTLIYKILKQKTKNAYLAGNIGSPPLSILGKTSEKDIVVLELSSFQLIDLQKSPNIAVVLNITSDHMDWHKDRDEYVDAKKNIIRFQNINDKKVINYDYDTSRSFTDLSLSQNYFFSRGKKVKGVYVKDGKIITNIHPARVHSATRRVSEYKIGSVDRLLIRGMHNWENVCAAICAAQLAGADIETIRKVVYSFKGLEHRLELAGEFAGVKYYNDSFSTNPQTTIAAVYSFNEPITLILGGYDKGLDFGMMAKHLCGKKNLKNIVLIGNLERKLLKYLKNLKFEGGLFELGKSDMEKIVARCKEVTKKGGVVLLSPACASFDMFKNYKDRGEKFKQAVNNIEI